MKLRIHPYRVESLEPRRLLSRLATSMAAMVLATVLALPAAAADPLPVYGGPTYSPSTGGYIAGEIDTSLYPSGHVNDAGTAVATATKYDSSGNWLGIRALRWSASSAATELGGGPNSVTSLRAERINSSGTTVGSVVVPNELHPYGNPQQYRPARWAASGTAATILEHPYVTNGAVSSYASTVLFDVNDSGTAVGTVLRTGYDQVGTPLDRGTRPGRWDGSGTALTELGVLGTDVDGYTQASARAINAGGVAVGETQKYDAGGAFLGTAAVRWDASGVAATELGHLGGSAPVGFAGSRAFAINSAGTAVGSNNVYGDAGNFLKHVPVRWDASGTATELGTLGGGYTTVVWSPAALNDAGTAVGSSDGVAVRWDGSGTAATELGNLGRHVSGATTSEASAVNAAGTTVGWAGKYVNGAPVVDGYTRAVYWGADTFAIDLNTLIDPGSGWLLTNALEISDTGWIVGVGQFDPDGPGGQAAYPRHFLMNVPATVPEPTAVSLIALYGLALLRRARRCAHAMVAGDHTRQLKSEPLEPRRLLSFVAASAIDTGVGPNWVAAGDLNGDGVADVAVANRGYVLQLVDEGSVSVHLGRGDGTFEPARHLAAGNYPFAVAMEDFNGDGRLDLAVNFNAGVNMLLGNGDGTFQTAQHVVPNVGFVAVGDFNGDGRLDFAGSEAAGGYLVFGNGDGTFQSPQYFPIGPDQFFPRIVGAGDFNSDGRLDLINVAYDPAFGGYESVLLSNGDGTFRAMPYRYVPADPDVLVAGDYNGDSRLDLAVAGNLSVLLGNGDGTFQAPWEANFGFHSSIVAADFNRDGQLDLAGAAGPDPYVGVTLGNGDGTFQFPRLAPTGWTSPSLGDRIAFLAVSEFNGDGRPDLAVTALAAGFVSVHLGNGDGTLRATPNYDTGYTTDLATGDFNGDERLDLAVGGDPLSVLLGNGDGTIQAPRYLTVSGGGPVAGDFNGDGRLDIAAGYDAGSLSIHLGKGNGTFQLPRFFAAGGPNPTHLVAGDVNGDGRPDLAVANWGTDPNYEDGSVSIHLSNGDGTFQPARTFPAHLPTSVALGDVNGDGRLDLAASIYGETDLSVRLGNGDGTFQPASSLNTAVDTQWVVAADFNSDGRADLAAANGSADNVSVLLSNGDGTLQPALNVAVQQPGYLATGDVNGDGRLDLFIAGYSVRVLLGNGDGTFRTNHVSYVAAGVPLFGALGDFNGDSLLDAATANLSTNNVSILINDGNWKTKAWIGPASGGNWSTAANWSPAGVPGAGDAVLIADSAVSLSSSVSIAELYLTGGATLTLATAGNHVLRTSTLSIGGNAKLDLNDNALILDYTGDSPVSAIRDYLVSGRNGGTWNGSGITSSAAAAVASSGLGFGEATHLFNTFPASFLGQGVDQTSILVRYTQLGDSNLNRTVDITDLGILASNWQQSPRSFSQGDFNYDANVDITDLGILATSWQQSLTQSPAPRRAPVRIAEELLRIADERASNEIAIELK